MGRRSGLVVTLILGGLLIPTLSGCVSSRVSGQIDRRINQGLTADELALARRVALTQARAEEATVTATVTVSAGTVPAARALHHQACSSGRLLQITLSGEFPRTPTTRVAGGGGTTRVHGEALTVDAATGRVCGDTFISGIVLPDRNAVRLFSE